MDQSEIEFDPKTDPRNRLAAGAFFALWAVAGWYSLLNNPQIAGVEFGADPGPGLLPAIVLTIISAGSLILVGAGLYGLGQLRAPPIAWMRIARQLTMPLLLSLSLVGYIPLIHRVGFLPANTVFAAGWMMLLSLDELRRNPMKGVVQIALGTLIGVGLIYYVFIYWIGVPLR